MVEFAKFFTDQYPDEGELAKPRSLVEAEEPEQFPIFCVPELIRNAITDVQAVTQAPVPLVAASAFAAVSTAVQCRFGVRRDTVMDGPATLYMLTLAESGERKSAADKHFVKPIKDWDAKQRHQHEAKMLRHNAELQQWERKRNEFGDDAEALIDHEMLKPEEPILRQMLMIDATPEALMNKLARDPIAAIITAEGGSVFGSHSMSKDVMMRNFAQLNKVWDGDTIQRDRVGSGETRVDRMRVTMGVQVQPGVFDDFTARAGGMAADSGFFPRFLISKPQSTQGQRWYKPPPPVLPGLERFQSRMTMLLDLEPTKDQFGRLDAQMIGFDDQAQREWEGFVDEVEDKLNHEDEYATIRAMASKAPENAARLACCFHVFCNDHSKPIDRMSINAARVLMRWYLSEARRLAKVTNAAPELADAQRLEEWLVTETRKRQQMEPAKLISVNEVRRKGPNSLRQSKYSRLMDALELLESHHRILVLRRRGKKGHDVRVRDLVMMGYGR